MVVSFEGVLVNFAGALVSNEATKLATEPSAKSLEGAKVTTKPSLTATGVGELTNATSLTQPQRVNTSPIELMFSKNLRYLRQQVKRRLIS